MRKWWVIPVSLLLLLPAQIFLLLFVLFFTEITGMLELGYIIGCVLFGTAAASPVLLNIASGQHKRSRKTLYMILVALLYTVLLFLSILMLRPIR
jgi:hypothetical protein